MIITAYLSNSSSKKTRVSNNEKGKWLFGGLKKADDFMDLSGWADDNIELGVAYSLP